MAKTRLNEIGRECLAVRVRLLDRTLTRLYDSALRPHGLTSTQLNLLATIDARQPVRAGRLAELLSMEISTLSRNVGLLEERGWARSAPAERGNSRVIELTPAGTRKLAEATPAWRSAQSEAKELLGDATDPIKRLVDGLWTDSGLAR